MIHIDLYATLDLVAQAPGAPDEDPFPFAGWQAPLYDETVGRHVIAGLDGMDALLLGRRTYDIFAAHWPHQSNVIGALFNRIPKYVASRGHPPLGWEGSTLLGPDLVNEVQDLRDKHEHVHVIGSLDLVQTLLRERLFYRLDLWLFPITLGTGKKVFDGGAVPANLTLREPPVTSPNGAVLLRYGVAPGTPATGDMREVT